MNLNCPHTATMKVIDQEKLDRLREPLKNAGIDPEALPAPDTDKWDELVSQLSQKDLALAQEFYSLPYDPEEQASAELIEQQSKRAQARGGLMSRLRPVVKTRTVNGDEVPNNKLIRNVALGLGAAAVVGFLLYEPPAPAKTTKKPQPEVTTQSPETQNEQKGIPSAPATGKPNGTSSIAGQETQASASDGVGSTVTADSAVTPDTSLSESTTPASDISASADVSSAPSEGTYTYPTSSNYAQTDEPASSSYTQSPNDSNTLDTSTASTPSTLVPAANPNAEPDAPVPTTITIQKSEKPVEATPRLPVALAQAPAVTPANKPGLVSARVGQSETGSGQEGGAAPRRPGLVSTSVSQNATSQTDGAMPTNRPGLVMSAEKTAPDATSTPTTDAREYGLISHESTAGIIKPGLNLQGMQDDRQDSENTTSNGWSDKAVPTGLQTGLQISQAMQTEKSNERQYGLMQSAAPTNSPPTATVPESSVSGKDVDEITTPSLPKLPYSMGQQLKAKLMTGAGVVEGAQSQVPVYAQAEDGSVWRGRPILDGRKRLQISFDAVAKDGREYPISANAYSPNDGISALPVKVNMVAPNAAFDMFNGLARGAQTFAQAMINQKTVSYQGSGSGSVTTQSTVTPNFWLTAGASLIGAMAVPESKSSIVLVGQLPVNTPLVIVVDGSGVKTANENGQ